MNYDPLNIVGPTTAAWSLVGDISTDLEFGGVAATAVSVTGMTADPYGFAYVTFYNTSTSGHPVSGLLEFDSFSGGPAIASFIPDTTLAWTSANSIFTDAMYGASNVYMLASPNTSVGAAGDLNHGTADVFIFDIYFNQVSNNPAPVARSFSTTIALGTGSSLTLPNKFVGMVEGGAFLVSQTDFAAGGTDYLSAVSLDLSSVKSVP